MARREPPRPVLIRRRRRSGRGNRPSVRLGFALPPIRAGAYPAWTRQERDTGLRRSGPRIPALPTVRFQTTAVAAVAGGVGSTPAATAGRATSLPCVARCAAAARWLPASLTRSGRGMGGRARRREVTRWAPGRNRAGRRERFAREPPSACAGCSTSPGWIGGRAPRARTNRDRMEATISRSRNALVGSEHAVRIEP